MLLWGFFCLINFARPALCWARAAFAGGIVGAYIYSPYGAINIRPE